MSKELTERWRIVVVCIALVVLPTVALVACTGDRAEDGDPTAVSTCG
jgi:hypothetical protein